MPDKYLVDTSVWILTLRPGAKERWIEDLRRELAEAQIVTNPLIQMELLTGALSEKQYEELSETFAAIPSLEITGTVWQEASRLGFILRRKGLTVPAMDILIAASAIHYHCVLYHCDRHYILIAQHSPLKTKVL